LVELQIINKILQTKSLAVLQRNGISADYFIGYHDEMEYIFRHHKDFGNVPDRETFVSIFTNFDVVDVNETDRYLIETLQEEFLYSKMVPFVHKIADLVKSDSFEARTYAINELKSLAQYSTVFKSGYDIVKNAMARYDDYDRRLANEGLLGITTGIEELDNITHGWMPGEDLIIILGRTNEGKSWLLLFFLVVAWLNGKKVLMYSGEMSHGVVGYRFDTLHGHFSNEALMQGEANLGEDRTPDNYRKYLRSLSEKDHSFVVVTPKDLGGRRMNVSDLNQLIEQEKPDIVGVDQLSLMEDERAKRGDQERTRFTHIAEDLFLSSETYGVPILAPAQANREAEKDKGESTPELHQIGESDGVGQNATRVISMRQNQGTLKIGVKKNRYGKRNQEIMMLWDIDKGIMRPFLVVTTNKDGEAVQTKKLTEGEDLF
jgi:replicative DNA helicase